MAKGDTKLSTEDYSTSVLRLPKTGRYISAQYDESSVVVYQAYRPAIARPNLIQSQYSKSRVLVKLDDVFIMRSQNFFNLVC
jgi:hypothetical protein